MTPCTECGYYRIHSRHCSHFEGFDEPEGVSERGEPEVWTPPKDAEETLLHFEQWVEPWASCFDCEAEQRGDHSLFAIEHHRACMVAFLHAKLAAECEAAEEV